MTCPRCTCDPSLTLSTARRPGILAETAALVRATTYPFATTATLPPLPPPTAPAPPLVVDTVTTCTGTEIGRASCRERVQGAAPGGPTTRGSTRRLARRSPGRPGMRRS